MKQHIQQIDDLFVLLNMDKYSEIEQYRQNRNLNLLTALMVSFFPIYLLCGYVSFLLLSLDLPVLDVITPNDFDKILQLSALAGGLFFTFLFGKIGFKLINKEKQQQLTSINYVKEQILNKESILELTNTLSKLKKYTPSHKKDVIISTINKLTLILEQDLEPSVKNSLLYDHLHSLYLDWNKLSKKIEKKFTKHNTNQISKQKTSMYENIDNDEKEMNLENR